MADPPNEPVVNPRVRLLIGMIILLGAVGLVLFNQRWVRSVFEGPVPVSLATLQGVKDPESLPNPWVSFTFDESIDTGFVMERTAMGTTHPESIFLLIRVGGRWLLADVPAAFTGNQVVGYLDTWWSPLSKKVIAHVKGRFPDREILPYQLNARYAQKSQCFSMLGIAAFIFLLGLYIVGLAWSDLRKLGSLAVDSLERSDELPADGN